MSASEELAELAENIRKKACQEEPKKETWFFWSKNEAKPKSVHRSRYYIPIEWNSNSKRVMFVAPNPSLRKSEGKAARAEEARGFPKDIEEIRFCGRK